MATSPIELKSIKDSRVFRGCHDLIRSRSFPIDSRRRDGRVAEGARLESVFTRKGNVGSNPTLSAKLFKIRELPGLRNPLSAPVSPLK